MYYFDYHIDTTNHVLSSMVRDQSESPSESSLSSPSLSESSLSSDESDVGSGFFFLLSGFAFGFVATLVFSYSATSFL